AHRRPWALSLYTAWLCEGPSSWGPPDGAPGGRDRRGSPLGFPGRTGHGLAGPVLPPAARLRRRGELHVARPRRGARAAGGARPVRAHVLGLRARERQERQRRPGHAGALPPARLPAGVLHQPPPRPQRQALPALPRPPTLLDELPRQDLRADHDPAARRAPERPAHAPGGDLRAPRSEEHTSEL